MRNVNLFAHIPGVLLTPDVALGSPDFSALSLWWLVLGAAVLATIATALVAAIWALVGKANFKRNYIVICLGTWGVAFWAGIFVVPLAIAIVLVALSP